MFYNYGDGPCICDINRKPLLYILLVKGQKPKPKVNGQKKRVEHSVSPLPSANCTRPEALAFLKKALRVNLARENLYSNCISFSFIHCTLFDS